MSSASGRLASADLPTRAAAAFALENSDIISSAAAVSYTHLDVYKRQGE